jgi:hypothetical protein
MTSAAPCKRARASRSALGALLLFQFDPDFIIFSTSFQRIIIHNALWMMSNGSQGNVWLMILLHSLSMPSEHRLWFKMVPGDAPLLPLKNLSASDNKSQ